MLQFKRENDLVFSASPYSFRIEENASTSGDPVESLGQDILDSSRGTFLRGMLNGYAAFSNAVKEVLSDATG